MLILIALLYFVNQKFSTNYDLSIIKKEKVKIVKLQIIKKVFTIICKYFYLYYFFSLYIAINADIIDITLDNIPAIENTKILYTSHKK